MVKLYYKIAIFNMFWFYDNAKFNLKKHTAMKIFSSKILRMPKIIPASRKAGTIAGAKKLKSDIYEKGGVSLLKKAQIKDISGHILDASFVCEKSSRKDAIKTLKCYVNGESAGHMRLISGDDEITIHSLMTEEFDKRKFVGIGTEFLKIAAEESRQAGHKGRVSVFAAHNPSPVLFYFKNNFRVEKGIRNGTGNNCLMDYALREHLSLEQLNNVMKSMRMELDERGSAALLRGERLCASNFSGVIYEKKIGNKTKIADWVHLSSDRFCNKNVVQLLEKDNDGLIAFKTALNATVRDTFCGGRAMVLSKCSDIPYYSRMQIEELEQAAKIKAGQLGIETVFLKL